jgi:transglutaminase-like putative cysteine protease
VPFTLRIQFPYLYPLLINLATVLAFFASAQAAPRAIIVVGLSASETQAARFTTTAATLREGFLARGFTDADITTLAPAPAAPLRREAVLAALASAAASSTTDETWLVLLGTAAPGRNGTPAFQLSGPRLSADDFAKAVAAIPGRKFIVIATTSSGGFLPPLLALPEVEATSATADSGQINEPRYGAFWAEALVALPRANFTELAATAADRVAAYYGENSLAQGETARLIDRASGKIIEAPFKTATSLQRTPVSTPAPPAKPVDIAKLSFPRTSTNDEIERRPADAESLATLAEGRAAAKGSLHAAIILNTESELLVARDFSTRETWRSRAYLRTGEALDELGTLDLAPDTPFTTASLVTARVIRPDGAQLLLNPSARSARLAAETEAQRDQKTPDPAKPFIELPEVTADCIVETEITIERRPDGTLPEFYQEWSFFTSYPQQSLSITLTIPRDSRWRSFAPNFPAASVVPAAPVATSTEAESGAVTQSWLLTDLAASEPFPGDPPARSFTPWLGVSSVASWDSFTAWYRRIATGSDTAGAGVAALAAEIAAAHPDRAGRLRAAYERVAALRYVAIELGVGAFRPRTPEQVWKQHHGDCKDKANLLIAVLAQLGIPAEFALVNRFDTTFTDFPGWQFNHALARVPAAPAAGQATDLWLDTTDRLVPFGIVAPGNFGRQALVFNRDFSSAAFHEITAAQEPPAVWRERFTPDPARGAWRIELSASGSAEVTLRDLVRELAPAARTERLRNLLALSGASVTEVNSGDPYDLATPYTIAFNVLSSAAAPSPRPLIPGLEAHLARTPTSHALQWDEGRDWRYIRTGAGTDIDQVIPGTSPVVKK